MAILNKFDDLYFTVDGDYLIGEDGDLKSNVEDVVRDNLAAIRQFVLHRLIGEYGAWGEYPQITAGLERFIGFPIEDATLYQIQLEAKRALTADLILNPADIDVRAVDLGNGAIALMVWAKQAGTKAITSFAFNMQNGQISRIL